MLIDPSRGMDEVGDVFVKEENIVNSTKLESDWDEIDAAGLWVVPSSEPRECMEYKN